MSTFDDIIRKHGVELDKKRCNIEYAENIVKSVETEIEKNISELRKDFPDIDKHIKEIRSSVVREWLDDYKKRYLSYNHPWFTDFGWENEDGDPHFICP